MVSVLCWANTSGNGACPGMWLSDLVIQPWRKLTFLPFASSYQLQIASCLGLLLLSSAWTCAILCKLSKYDSHVYQPCFLWMTLFPWNHPPVLTLTMFVSDQWALRESLIKTFHSGMSVPKSLTHFILWVSMLINIYCKRKFLLWQLRETQNYENTAMFL